MSVWAKWFGAHEGRTRRLATPALPIVAIALVATGFVRPLWQYLAQGFELREVGYVQIRLSAGFRGLDVEALKLNLDKRLAVSVPVAIDPALRADDSATQRLPEGLYPRRVVQESPYTLVLNGEPEGSLATYAGRGHIHLQAADSATPGIASADASVVEAAPQSWPRPSWALFVLQVLSVLGWGGIAFLALGRWKAGLLPHSNSLLGQIGFAGVAGAGVIAVFATTATWTQLALSKNVVAAGGLVGFALLSARYCLKNRGALLERFRSGMRSSWFESGFLALVGSWFMHLAVLTPVLGWDGRSIWFFRAHQVAHEGRFAHVDVHNLTYFFSHPSYPLLFPSWLSHFTAFGSYDERQAALGVPVILVFLLATVLDLARPLIGRLAAVVFALALYFGSVERLQGGYPDPVVSLLLVISALALVDHRTMGIALAAVLAASLTKREGFAIAAFLVLAWVLLSRPHEQWNRKNRLAALGVALLPAMGHSFWYRLQELPEVYGAARFGSSAEITQRVGAILVRFFELGGPFPIVYVGVGSFVAVGLGWSARREGYIFALAGLGAFGLCMLALVTTPFPFMWHVSLSLPRIVMHALWLFVTAAIVHFRRLE